MRIFDGHTHSLHSFDGSETVLNMLTAAEKAGVEQLSITDHCDLGIYYREDWRQQFEGLKADIAAAKENYSGPVKLCFGIELGQELHDPETAKKALSLFDFDIVIGSVHNVKDTEDFYFLTQSDIDKRDLVSRYFAEQLELAKQGDFDVLGHLTYAYRYLGYGDDMPKPQEFEPLLRELFAALIQRGKALEVNTSGMYRIPAQPAMPDLWELKLYRECGGEMIALGSDAHKAENIGKSMKEAQELLRAAGFKYQTTFVERKPQLIKL
ncbi:MAG: histidinol-phosphatase HisJ family protein [Oscillospiraceae bacterium]|nr:histidinol-phosphatase HisJ family protein [Oscillospiraceae bacterium]MBP1556483.1 histidinol-phosphatase HisJ family protein [Oscillospiraceae bacterium]